MYALNTPMVLEIRDGGMPLPVQAPPAVGAGLFLLRPDYIKTLFNHAFGIVAVIIAASLAIVGYFWLRRIVDIEV